MTPAVRTIEVTLNGQRVRTPVEPHETLLGVLRQRLAATEVKSGCERGDCGACAVILDGKAINSCLALAVQAAGKTVLTVRGLGTPESPHPLQTAFVDAGAAQCGICIPGMLVSLYAFLRVTDDLADEPGDPAAKRAALADWRTALLAALSGRYSHPVHPALHDTVARYAIPPEYLLAVLVTRYTASSATPTTSPWPGCSTPGWCGPRAPPLGSSGSTRAGRTRWRACARS